MMNSILALFRILLLNRIPNNPWTDMLHAGLGTFFPDRTFDGSKIHQLHQLRTWQLIHSIRMLVGISLSNLFEPSMSLLGDVVRVFVNKHLIKPMGGATCQGTKVFGILLVCFLSSFG